MVERLVANQTAGVRFPLLAQKPRAFVRESETSACLAWGIEGRSHVAIATGEAGSRKFSKKIICDRSLLAPISCAHPW